jgi:HTH-type transcriptional regulator/antitoxin HigA
MEETMTVTDQPAYSALLLEERPHVIRTAADNTRALARIDELMRQNELSPAEVEILDLLTLLVERFEEQRYAMKAASPVQVLRELMAANGVPQSEIAEIIGSKGLASELLSGKREISKSQAVKLGERFGVPAAVFLGL